MFTNSEGVLDPSSLHVLRPVATVTDHGLFCRSWTKARGGRQIEPRAFSKIGGEPGRAGLMGSALAAPLRLRSGFAYVGQRVGVACLAEDYAAILVRGRRGTRRGHLYQVDGAFDGGCLGYGCSWWSRGRVPAPPAGPVPRRFQMADRAELHLCVLVVGAGHFLDYAGAGVLDVYA